MCDNAVNARAREIQRRGEITERLRARSFDMPRSVEGLVDMADQAREDAVRFRLAELAAVAAARETQERVDPSVAQLRQQLHEAQPELAAAFSPQIVREHAEELRAARREEAEQARTIACLKDTSATQAAEDTLACLELERAERRMYEVNKPFHQQNATMRLARQKHEEQLQTTQKQDTDLKGTYDRCGQGWRPDEHDSG